VSVFVSQRVTPRKRGCEKTELYGDTQRLPRELSKKSELGKQSLSKTMGDESYRKRGRNKNGTATERPGGGSQAHGILYRRGLGGGKETSLGE